LGLVVEVTTGTDLDGGFAKALGSAKVTISDAGFGANGIVAVVARTIS
jgi:hypothetical protein